MASIGNDKNGHRRILFAAGDGTRRTVRLGKMSKSQAQSHKIRIEDLIAAAGGAKLIEDETAKYLADLPDVLHARLAAVGLVKGRTGGRAVMGAFIDNYLAGRPGLKPNTVLNMQQARRWLVNHFGENRDMRSVTPGDAEDWQASMIAGGLGTNTLRRHVGRARQLWKSAIRRGLVRGNNPFDGMAAKVTGNKDRQFFVTADAAAKVLAACPDAEWRLLFALSRWGGLRCPSEHLALAWADVDFDHKRLRVPSPKTEHHEGKAERIIPIFAEIMPHLLDVFHEAPEGATRIITRYRGGACNLRTQLCRIIRKAGLTVWPKPWHNLRATRQTELAETYPLHVVCQWIGNSGAIAQEHYLQVNDAHFAKATAEPELKPDSAAQNPAQYTSITAGNGKNQAKAQMQNRPDLPSDSAPYLPVQNPYYPQGESNPCPLAENQLS